MKEDFKKWLCDKIGYPCFMQSHIIDILIRVMWAINRERYDIFINMDETSITIFNTEDEVPEDVCTIYEYKDYNNSEIEALEKALEYIYKDTKE